MSILTALLTHDQVVTPRKIDEAIQRQVISGGDIETHLLELGVIAEDTLAAYCAAVYGLDAAPRQDVLDADPVAIARVPRDLAVRAQVVPLHTESGVLVLACGKAPTPADLGPVEAMCGMKTVLRVVVPFRLAWAMWRYYQLPLEARLARLADRQQALPAGAMPKVVRPPALSGVPADTPTVPSIRKGATLSALATLMAALEDDEPEEPEEPVPASVPPPLPVATPRASAPTPPAPSTQRPIALPEARERLTAARSRDAVVEVLLDHARATFTYAALLVVHGDRCEGVSGRGLGATTEQVRRLSFSLDEPGVLHDVRERTAPVIARITTAADRALREGLERRAVTDVALIPLRIGTRAALILWVDKGMSPPSATLIAPLAAFVEECAAALARIILERKQSSNARASVPPRPSVILRSGNAPVDGRPAAATTPARPSVRPSRMPPREARLEALRHALSTPPPALSSAPPPLSPSENPPGTRPATERPAPVVVVPRPSVPPGTEAERLVTEVIETNALPDPTAAALLSQGERALDAIFKHFPGPNTLDGTHVLTRLPVLSDAGPLLRLVIAFRQASLSRLVAALDDPSPESAERRYCALLCLGEVVHPSALGKLTPHLFDPDPAMQSAATEVLRQYRRFAEFDNVGSALRTLLRDPTAPPERRRVAAQAIGALRDTQAVQTLIQALDDADAGIAVAAHRALVVLTRQDFGPKPAGWSEWWSAASSRHRVEWLIDALLHSDSTIRHEASEELKRVTGQFFGYYFNLPRKERERAHQRYQEWWRREGAARFTGPT